MWCLCGHVIFTFAVAWKTRAVGVWKWDKLREIRCCSLLSTTIDVPFFIWTKLTCLLPSFFSAAEQLKCSCWILVIVDNQLSRYGQQQTDEINSLLKCCLLINNTGFLGIIYFNMSKPRHVSFYHKSSLGLHNCKTAEWPAENSCKQPELMSRGRRARCCTVSTGNRRGGMLLLNTLLVAKATSW